MTFDIYNQAGDFICDCVELDDSQPMQMGDTIDAIDENGDWIVVIIRMRKGNKLIVAYNDPEKQAAINERVGVYHTLAVKWHEGSLWTPEFGDYDKKVVEQERIDGYQDIHAYRIIKTMAMQVDINASIDAMNAAEQEAAAV